MAVKIVNISPEFIAGFPQSADTSARNFSDIAAIEMKKLAPFLTGALETSIGVRKQAPLNYNIAVGVPYGIYRNFHNNLHPNTKHYVENGVQSVLDGDPKRWWTSGL